MLKKMKLSTVAYSYIITKRKVCQIMLSELIKSKRISLGISIYRLSKITNHPVSTLHHLENGLIKNPRFELIIDIGEALGLSLDDMKEAYVAQNKSDD